MSVVTRSELLQVSCPCCRENKHYVYLRSVSGGIQLHCASCHSVYVIAEGKGIAYIFPNTQLVQVEGMTYNFAYVRQYRDRFSDSVNRMVPDE